MQVEQGLTAGDDDGDDDGQKTAVLGMTTIPQSDARSYPLKVLRLFDPAPDAFSHIALIQVVTLGLRLV